MANRFAQKIHLDQKSEIQWRTVSMANVRTLYNIYLSYSIIGYCCTVRGDSETDPNGESRSSLFYIFFLFAQHCILLDTIMPRTRPCTMVKVKCNAALDKSLFSAFRATLAPHTIHWIHCSRHEYVLFWLISEIRWEPSPDSYSTKQ